MEFCSKPVLCCILGNLCDEDERGKGLILVFMWGCIHRIVGSDAAVGSCQIKANWDRLPLKSGGNSYPRASCIPSLNVGVDACCLWERGRTINSSKLLSNKLRSQEDLANVGELVRRYKR